MIDENNNAITFSDVAGCDEAKDDAELVDFLRDPLNFKSLEVDTRGVLMVGPRIFEELYCQSNCWKGKSTVFLHLRFGFR